MIRRQSVARRFHRGVMLGVVCLNLAALTRITAQEAEDVSVRDPRPLAAAIKEFAKRCQCVITYEDVQWGPNQLEVSPVLRRRSDGAPVMIPRGTPFTFTVSRNLSAMTPAEVAQSLRLVMDRYESSQNTGQFKLVHGQTALHILPAHSAILERPVNVTANETPALVAIQAAVDELGRVSGEKVGMWRMPLNILKRPIRMTISNEPAYEAIGRLLDAVDRRLSSQLIYDVNAKKYFLTIYFAYH